MFPVSQYIVCTRNCTWAEIFFFPFLDKIQGLIIDVLTLAFQPGWDCQFFPHAVVSKVFLLVGGGEIVLYCSELVFTLPP